MKEIWQELEKLGYPDNPGLDYTNEFTCLVAVVLSARTRDAFLNTQTPPLFKDAPDAESMYALGVDGIAHYIRKVGLWHNKAKFVHKLAGQAIKFKKMKEEGKEQDWYDNLCEKYIYDDEMEDAKCYGPTISESGLPSFRLGLMQMAGVGRKTANVFLNQQYNAPVFPVDTHVKRLSYRIGIVDEPDVKKIEETLHSSVPEPYKSTASTKLVWHGRKVCLARKPKCSKCSLKKYCNYFKNLYTD